MIPVPGSLWRHQWQNYSVTIQSADAYSVAFRRADGAPVTWPLELFNARYRPA